jgi:hypothetical protein
MWRQVLFCEQLSGNSAEVAIESELDRASLFRIAACPRRGCLHERFARQQTLGQG